MNLSGLYLAEMEINDSQRRSRWLVGFLAWVFLTVSAMTAAAADTGSIRGRITDPQDAAVPGVTIDIRGIDTGLMRTTVTDGNGSYLLAALPIGRYDVTVSLS